MQQSKFIKLCVNRLAPVIYLFLFLVVSTASVNTLRAETEFDIRAKSEDVEKEYRQELDKWMLRAYEGDPDAQFKVGVLFTNQQFDSADFEQAVYWYTQAARQGHVLAQYNLGHQYLNGVGVRKSEKNAMEWWLKAASQDHALAQFNIGRAYYLGIGVKEDHAQSKIWFNRAARNQEPKSIDILTQLGWNEEAIVVAEKSAQTTVQENSADMRVVSEPKPSGGTSEQLASKLVPADIASKPTIAPAASTIPSSVTLYTNPEVRSVLIGVVDDRETLQVIERGEEWYTVTSSIGFPVWVHEDYIDDRGPNNNGHHYGAITGSAVNSRSVPIITHGTVVGRLNKGERITVLEKSKDWYRIVAPTRFKAWVRVEDFKRRPAVVPEQAPAMKPTIATPTVVTTPQADSSVSQQSSKAESSDPIGNPQNDNQWLFKQPVENYTLQLASFDEPQKVADFIAGNSLEKDTKLHRFSSTGGDIQWTYFLYGSYATEQMAEAAKSKLGQKRAWVRTISRLQQNRCIAWKKQLPPPAELNQYCSG